MWNLIVLAAIVLHCSAQDLVVELTNGKVRGTTLTTPSGREVYTWRGVPYAKPPVGELRFKAPVRAEPWKGTLDATKDSKSCIFVGSFPGDPVPTYGYSEDCLYVNVYSPVKPGANASLPVMFWIYGGGFFAGSSDFAFYDPTPLVLDDVIVVSFNYRLSVFGFLSTDDQVVPGNSALKDQLAALIWTRENIASFGGNPLDITIFGESAGAMSVGYHLVSPMSRNLFTGAIMESGTALLTFLQDNPRENTVVLAKSIDSSINDNSTTEDLLKVLQSADADLLVKLTSAHNLSFKPVLEVNNSRPFLLKDQPLFEAIEAGNIAQVPIIIGTNSAEEIFVAQDPDSAKQMAETYDKNTSLLLPSFNLKADASVKTVTEKIKEAYVGNGSFSDNLGELVNWVTDNTFARPAVKHAQLQSKFTKVYAYQFSFVGTLSKSHPVIPGCGRVGHAEELGYLFNISTKPLATEADYLTRSRFVKLWTNFAKFKNPTPNADLPVVKWKPFDTNKLQYLDIGDELEPKENLKGNLPDFWTDLWETYATRPYNTF